MRQQIHRYLLFVTISVSVPSAFGIGPEIKKVDAIPNGYEERIEVQLSAPVTPTVRPVSNPSRLIIDFPNASTSEQQRQIMVNRNGVKRVSVGSNHAIPLTTRVIVYLDSLRPFGIETSGSKVVLSILEHPAETGPSSALTNLSGSDTGKAVTPPDVAGPAIAASSASPPPQVQSVPVESFIEQPQTQAPIPARPSFRVKYIAGSTVYIDGGSNSGLREGMKLDIRDPHPSAAGADRTKVQGAFIASLRVIGVAATSAITEVRAANGQVQIGDRADLTPEDAAVAAANAPTTSATVSRAAFSQSSDQTGSPGKTEDEERNSPRPTEKIETDGQSRMAGRFGLDYSGISSSGSTPGASTQVGLSFQSDMTRILGTHWNLEGYWRGRINRHSQFREPTIEETLNKTYTMQLFYDNPNSKWVAGVGRLYLPWAVSLDTIDGGYLGRKTSFGMTTGIFAGSTPDLTSWNYQPDHRIGGLFANFQGGAYEGFQYTSTSGVALSTIDWKLDRPYAFFENEVSYKGIVSVYNSLIADSPRGVSTNGIRPGAGISHSYSTAHFQPKRSFSFDLYHNYFRDVPTAATSIVGTGLVDKLLFQGISAGVHLRPTRHVTLYTTLGASEKTGDSHRSLNQMYGATWSEIAHSGIRADFHYSKFDSNFGQGNYRVFSVSRQMTNRTFLNFQVGNQDMFSLHTANYASKFISNSMDVNLGKHSYLQSGYTYVNGASLNYRQWYLSWGYRFDKGHDSPQYVQSLDSTH